MLGAQGADAAVNAAVTTLWQAWNQLPEAAGQALALPNQASWPLWQKQVAAWGQRLAQQGDLASSLRQFVFGKLARS
jgi:hypothetical protein